MKYLVTGAGGFIGGHLTQGLLHLGHEVVAVDVKEFSNWYQVSPEARNVKADLMDFAACYENILGVDGIFNLAADMGGMGFIENNKASCMLSVAINTNLLRLSKELGIERFFFSSSACVYAANHQTSTKVVPLKEGDAYPALPEDGYGWEKLFSERMCRHFREDFAIQTRIARYHNVYGPLGTFDGGREKAPAAICRKIASAKIQGKHEIEVWGDGEQRRSFMWIEDCIRGTLDVFHGSFGEPVNLGSSETVSINELVSIVEEIAGIKVTRNYNKSAPQGVRGRSSDNTLFRSTYGWEPSTSLREGLEKTYRWIYDQLKIRTN